MVGNVGQLVESMNAANNAKLHQNTSNSTSDIFKNYLDTALLNSRGGLFSDGLGSGYSYLNPLSGSVWQTAMLEALRDELKKGRESEDEKSDDLEEETSSPKAQKEKKEDWARIRVIRRYQAPMVEGNKSKKEIVV